jgi:hypothetical protein
MEHPTRKVAAVIAVVAGLVLVPADMSAQVTGAQPAPAGEYKLAMVDTVNLPALISEANNCRDEVTDATLTFGTDNTWRVTANVRRTCGTEVTTETATEEGKFTVSGDTIDFDPGDAEQQDTDPNKVKWTELATGTIKDNEITVKLEEDRKTLVFRKP